MPIDITVSGFHSFSLIFIVASSSVFYISILVLTLLLELMLSRCSLYDTVKEDIFLSLSSSFNENFVESYLIKASSCFSNFASNFESWSAIVYFKDSLNL